MLLVRQETVVSLTPGLAKTGTLMLRCFDSEEERPGGAQGRVGMQAAELCGSLSKHHQSLGLTFPKAALLR